MHAKTSGFRVKLGMTKFQTVCLFYFVTENPSASIHPLFCKRGRVGEWDDLSLSHRHRTCRMANHPSGHNPLSVFQPHCEIG